MSVLKVCLGLVKPVCRFVFGNEPTKTNVGYQSLLEQENNRLRKLVKKLEIERESLKRVAVVLTEDLSLHTGVRCTVFRRLHQARRFKSFMKRKSYSSWFRIFDTSEDAVEAYLQNVSGRVR